MVLKELTWRSRLQYFPTYDKVSKVFMVRKHDLPYSQIWALKSHFSAALDKFIFSIY